MLSLIRFSGLIVAILGFGACSLTPPIYPASMSDNHDIHFTDAMSRSIHVFRGEPNPENYRVCVEPSPDAGLDADETRNFGGLSASGMGGVFGQGGDAQVGTGSLNQTSGRAANLVLSSRTTGLQVFRDTLSQACLAYAQGVISAEAYADFLRAAAAGAIAMSAIESMTATESSFWSSNPRQGQADAEVDHDEIYDLAQLSMYILMMTYGEQRGQIQTNLQELYDMRIQLRRLEIERREIDNARRRLGINEPSQ